MARIDLLRGFLEENANDSFSRYALSLELIKLGQLDDARREFETVREKDPDYLATYYQLGQLYVKLGFRDLADQTFRAGIAVALKQGDGHTQSELEAALDSVI